MSQVRPLPNPEVYDNPMSQVRPLPNAMGSGNPMDQVRPLSKGNPSFLSDNPVSYQGNPSFLSDNPVSYQGNPSFLSDNPVSYQGNPMGNYGGTSQTMPNGGNVGRMIASILEKSQQGPLSEYSYGPMQQGSPSRTTIATATL